MKQSEDLLHLELNLTPAYPTEARLEKLIRSFLYTKGPKLQQAEMSLIDEYRFREERNRVEEIFISFHQPRVELGCIIWQGESGQATVFYDETRFQTELEVIHIQKHNSESVLVYRVRLTAEQLGKEAEFKFRFVLE